MSVANMKENHNMKRIVIIILLLSLSNVKAQINKVDIIATGLTCSMCSNAIYKQLQSIEGVEKVEIDLNKNLFTAILKKENKLTPKDFKEKVEKAGFFIGSMVLYLSYYNLSITDGTKNGNYIIIDSKPQTLNGEKRVQVLDKGYVTAKEFKKLSKAYSKYETFAKAAGNNYHIKVLY